MTRHSTVSRLLSVFAFGLISVVASLSVATRALAYAIPQTPSDYFYPGEIFAGQKLLVDMNFSTYPVSSIGAANAFIFNAGSSSIDLTGSTTNLYIGDQLAGNVQTSQLGVFALFANSTVSGLPGVWWTSTQVDDALLTSFFSGTQSGTLEIIPTFTSGNGMVNLGGWTPMQ